LGQFWSNGERGCGYRDWLAGFDLTFLLSIYLPGPHPLPPYNIPSICIAQYMRQKRGRKKLSCRACVCVSLHFQGKKQSTLELFVTAQLM
jgi:hypothetical protein